jgi:hypothetical protein
MTEQTQPQLTDEEQGVLRSAAMRAGVLVAGAEPAFLDTFKESFAASKAVKAAPPEIQQLIAQGGFPEMPKGDKAEVEGRTLELLRQAVGILQAKAPHLLDGYRATVTASARDVAAAADDTSAAESDAITKIEQALSGPA